MRPSRRAVLAAGIVGAGGLGYLLLRTDSGPDNSPLGHTNLPSTPAAVPPVRSIDRTTVAPREQALAPFLLTVPAFANDISTTRGPERGTTSKVWARDNNGLYDARVSELVIVLAWFYTQERPWNPLAGNAALLARLEAVLDHYLGLQHQDGSWPEHTPDHHGRAATAFALGYLSLTLTYLKNAHALISHQGRIQDAITKGAFWFLSPVTNHDWNAAIIEGANQTFAGLAGCAQVLRHVDSPELSRQLDARIAYAATHAQSPAGFLYEPDGMDVGYNLTVALPQIASLHQEIERSPYNMLVQRLADWFCYVFVPEPEDLGFIAMASASARTQFLYLDYLTDDDHASIPASPLSTAAPQLRALFTSTEDREILRQEWTRSHESVEPKHLQPRVVANASLPEQLPTRAERQAAIHSLSPVSRDRFTEVRTSDRNQIYLFLRRPTYYVQAFFGVRPSNQVRAGMGTFWNPEAGTFIHASNDTQDYAWGVFDPDGKALEGTSRLHVEAPSPTDLAAPPVPLEDLAPWAEPRLLRWADPVSGTRVRVEFADHYLERTLTTSPGAVEQIPLLLGPDDQMQWNDGTAVAYKRPTFGSSGIAITRGATTLHIRWSSRRDATLAPQPMTYFRDAARRVYILRVPLDTQTRVRYSITGPTFPQTAS